jgi:PAS domain S-box-containing protein
MKHKLADMMCLDIFTSQLAYDDYQNIEAQIGIPNAKAMPMLSWDLFIDDHYDRLQQARKRIELQQVLSFAKKFKWKNDLDLAFSENDYEALIITDKDQNIIWVNDGFTTMTGYSKKFAINKTPRFLQGKDTSIATKKEVKEQLIKAQPFKGVITNYRKDHTAYNCEVKIIPLYSEHTTHFIAFEKQVI